MIKKFLLVFLMPLVLLITVAGIVAYQYAARGLREQVDQRLLATTESVHADVISRFDAVLTDLRVIANHPALTQNFAFSRLGQPASADRKLRELTEYFVSVAEINEFYADVRLFDLYGRSLAGVHEGERDYRAMDRSGKEWFRRTLASDHESSCISKTQFRTANETCLVFSQLISRGGPDRLDGVMAIEVRIDGLLAESIARRPIGRDGHVYLVNANGTVVLHENPAQIGRDVSDRYSTRRAFEGYMGVTTSSEDDGLGPMRAGFMPIADTDLALVIAIPEAEVFEPIADLRRTAIPIAMAMCLVLGLFGVVIVRSVIRPIRTLSLTARAVSAGNLDARCELSTGDEIEELADSFNAMTTNLKANRDRLESEHLALIRTSEELTASQNHLAITLDSIGDGVIATDQEGRIDRMNRVAETLTGYTSDQALGRPLSEVFNIVNLDTREAAESPVSIVLKTGEAYALTNRTILISNDDTEHHIAESGAPIRDESGEIVGVVLVFRNVSESHRLEELLRQTQKMDSIGQLAGGVAHDFNNLLMIIAGNAENLVDLFDDDQSSDAEEGRTSVESILKASKRGADLTSQLLTFSGRTPTTRAVCDLNELIRRVAGICTRAFDKRIRIETKTERDPTPVCGDESTLENAILNLALNSRDAMPDGGTLTFVTRTLEIDEAQGATHAPALVPGTYVELLVSDTGAGMEEATRARLFEPFFTTKPIGKGTGLGMAAVYGTVLSHDGAIDVESQPLRGTQIAILLPRSDEPIAAKPTPKSVKKGEGRIIAE